VKQSIALHAGPSPTENRARFHVFLTAPACATGLVLLINLVFDTLWPNTLSPVIALGLYFIALMQIFTAYPFAFILILPFVILHASAMFSLVTIENGADMKEVAYTGYPTAATSSYVLYALVFLIAAVLAYTYCKTRYPVDLIRAESNARRLTGIVRNAPLFVVIVAILFLLAVGVKSGFPLIKGTDRFAFRRLEADPITLNLLNLKFLIAAILGSSAVFATSRFSRRLHHAVLLAYLLTSFLFGDKFFAILTSGSIYITAQLLLTSETVIVRTVAFIAPIALAAVVAVFSMTLYIYSDYGKTSLSEAFSKVADRIAGQGQLWFMAHKDTDTIVSFKSEMVAENIRALVNVPSSDYAFDHRLGPFYFVEKYYPRALYAATLHNAGWVSPTVVFEAYGLVIFGYVGLVFLMAAAGFVAGALSYYFSSALLTGNMFSILLPAYIFDATFKVMSQGTLYNIFGLSAFKAYTAFGLLQIVVAMFVRGSRRHQGKDTPQVTN